MTTTSPVSLSLSYRAENKRFSTLKRIKTGGIQPKLNVACFVQSCLTDADFVLFSNYCLIGTRLNRSVLFISVFPYRAGCPLPPGHEGRSDSPSPCARKSPAPYPRLRGMAETGKGRNHLPHRAPVPEGK